MLLHCHYFCTTTRQPLQWVRLNYFIFSYQTLTDSGDLVFDCLQSKLVFITKCSCLLNQHSVLHRNQKMCATFTVSSLSTSPSLLSAADWAEEHLSHQWICVNGFGVCAQRLAGCSYSVDVSTLPLHFIFSFSVKLHKWCLKSTFLEQSHAVKSPGRLLVSTAGTTVWGIPNTELSVSFRLAAAAAAAAAAAHRGPTLCTLCPRRFSPRAAPARALLGRSLPACSGAAAAEPPQTEPPAG